MSADQIARYAELTAKGILQVRHGEFHDAVESFTGAHRIAVVLKDQHLTVKAICNLSTARLGTGEIRKAEQGLREILLKSNDQQSIFVASSNLASALRRQGLLEKALVFAKRSLRASELLADSVRKASSHNLVGNIYLNMSYHDDAIAEYRFALALSEEGGGGASYPVDYIKENLGYCLLLKKRHRQGISMILEALQIALENENRRCVAECNQDLSFAYMQTKELDRAAEYGEKALAIAREQEFTDIVKNCYYLLGEIHLLRGDETKSDEYFDQLQALYPNLPVLKDFLRTFDVSNIISLKNPF